MARRRARQVGAQPDEAPPGGNRTGLVQGAISSVAEAVDGHVEQPPTPAQAPPSRRFPTRAASWAPVPVLVAVLPLLAVGVHAVSQIHRQAVYGGDYALLEMGARSALRGVQRLGPYSRFGWNHLGPSTSYWSAPFYALSGQRPEGLAIAAVASNLVALGGIVYVARRAGGVVVGWGAAAIVVYFLFVSGPTWLDQPWNPISVILPMAALGVLGAATVAGRRWCLPFAVAAASYAAQTHIGTLPSVVVVVLVVAPLVIWRWRRDRVAWHRPVLVAGLVLGAMWALPLVEQLGGHPGNMTLAQRFFARNGGTQHPLGDVLKISGPQLTLSRGRVVSRLTLPPASLPSVSTALMVKLVALVALATSFLGLNVWRRRWFCVGLSVAGLAGGLTSVLAAQHIVGQLFGYLTSASVAAGLVLWLAIGTTAASEVRILAAQLPKSARFSGGALGVVALVLASGLLVPRNAQGRLFATRRARTQLVAVVAEVRAQVPAGRHRGVYIDPQVNTTAWSFAALVANQLERKGIVVRTPAAWEFMFGSQRTGRPGRLPHVRFVDLERDKRLRGSRMLGQLGRIRAYLVER